VGSKLIGQPFAEPVMVNGKVKKDSAGNPVLNPDPRYFQPRPSATTPVYNAAGSTFSNLGPNSTAALQEFQGNIQTYLQLEGPYNPGLNAAHIPVDAVQSSASGLDPDISTANAAIQARRVAAVRHLPLSVVDKLVADNTGGRGLGLFGEKTVNVLTLNLALDRQTPKA
jgi:K+-transporting ATPase ATPase C chain